MLKLSDLDLNQIVEATVWEGSHLSLTVTILVFGVIIIGVGSFIFIFLGDKIYSFWVGIAMIMIGLAISMTAQFSSELFYPLDKIQSEETSKTEKIQVWAENNYAIELSKKDAKVLYNGRLDYDYENSAKPQKTGAIVDYYNKSTVIHLVRVDDEWKLFSNDVELPTTGGAK